MRASIYMALPEIWLWVAKCRPVLQITEVNFNYYQFNYNSFVFRDDAKEKVPNVRKKSKITKINSERTATSSLYMIAYS